MRTPLIAGLAVAALAVAACDRNSSAKADLKNAGQEANAAVSDVGKAIKDSTPTVKQAGKDIGAGIKRAGDGGPPSIKEAGHDLGPALNKGAVSVPAPSGDSTVTDGDDESAVSVPPLVDFSLVSQVWVPAVVEAVAPGPPPVFDP